ncbi:PLDc_N domain-containing protein [Aliishimia ponticola]|uniref:PLDc_N domain-containing protein n=1 Tax=Aliishimia ponticola TaxID=2499833 RepID=A0A4S4NIU8_9RHOB|nr:PLD nuclease N-terminal domain-containing protein [Aliishimia ponticola]THH38131.1 PLDc_N domain-containing protein [Aliishimia ponticola]
MFEVAGILGLIGLALSLWALVSIISSNASTGAKVGWSLFVIVLPVIGFIVWFFVGPRARKAAY